MNLIFLKVNLKYAFKLWLLMAWKYWNILQSNESLFKKFKDEKVAELQLDVRKFEHTFEDNERKFEELNKKIKTDETGEYSNVSQVARGLHNWSHITEGFRASSGYLTQVEVYEKLYR